MSEANAEDNTNVSEEETKGRDTAKHGSHFTTPPQTKYEDKEEEESKE